MLVDKCSAIVKEYHLRNAKTTDNALIDEIGHYELVAFFKGMTSTHLVYNSLVARIQMCPREGGFIGPMKSMAQVWNGHGVPKVLKSTASV